MSRTKGCITGVRDPRSLAYPASKLVGASPAPSSVDLSKYAFTGLDQGHCNSCVGFAVAQALFMRMRILGIPGAVLPSARAIYYQARARRNGWQNVTDVGSVPLDAWASVRELGAPKWSDFFYDQERINAAPPPGVFRHPAVGNPSYYWIFKGQKQTMQQVLAERRPFTFSLPVDAPFEDATGSDWPDEPWEYSGNLLGYHYVTAVGYASNGISMVNSWGLDWGVGGFWLVGWDTILTYADDVVVPEVS